MTKLGLKSDLDTKLSVAKWNELKGRYALSKEQLDISDKSIQAQVEAQKVQIEKLEAAFKLKKEQVEQLVIRSGTDGTLTQLGAGPEVSLAAVVASAAVAGAWLPPLALPLALAWPLVDVIDWLMENWPRPVAAQPSTRMSPAGMPCAFTVMVPSGERDIPVVIRWPFPDTAGGVTLLVQPRSTSTTTTCLSPS